MLLFCSGSIINNIFKLWKCIWLTFDLFCLSDWSHWMSCCSFVINVLLICLCPHNSMNYLKMCKEKRTVWFSHLFICYQCINNMFVSSQFDKIIWKCAYKKEQEAGSSTKVLRHNLCSYIISFIVTKVNGAFKT